MDIAYCELLEGVILFTIQWIDFMGLICWGRLDKVQYIRPGTRISTASLSHAEDE